MDPMSTTMPLDVYGEPCNIEGATTSTCFVTTNPISMLLGNGTLNMSTGILLMSTNYPQVNFSIYINTTVYHYRTNFENLMLQTYDSVISNFSNMSTSYNNVCTGHDMCSQYISKNLTLINDSISAVRDEMAGSTLENVSSDLASVSANMTVLKPVLDQFINQSEQTLRMINTSKSVLANASNTLASNSVVLNNCTLSNGTVYYAYLDGSIRHLESYNPPAWNTSSSESYLNLTLKLKSNQTTLVRACASKSSTASSALNIPQLLSRFEIPIMILLVVLVSLYAVIRLNEYRTVMSIRKAESTEPKEQPENQSSTKQPVSDEAKKRETEGVKAVGIEGVFDDWLSSTFSKKNKGDDRSNNGEG
jgi:hypothetical protein